MREALHELSYPTYVIDVVGRGVLVVAGGGGEARTGVPNRIELIRLTEDNRSAPPKSIAVTASVIGGISTGQDAVMSLAAVNSGNSAFVLSLEGSRCVEYLARSTARPQNKVFVASSCLPNGEPVSADTQLKKRNVQQSSSNDTSQVSPKEHATSASHSASEEWELVKLRSFGLDSRLLVHADLQASSSLSCVATGGPAGRFIAIGSDTGSVYLFNRHTQSSISSTCDGDQSDILTPFLIYSDVSGGCSAPVWCLDLTTGSFPKSNDAPSEPNCSPLLVTLCEQPDCSTLRVWTTATCVSDDSTSHSNSFPACSIQLHPCASASCSVFSSGLKKSPVTGSTTGTNVSERHEYRFRHCKFLRGLHRVDDQTSAYLLVTTVRDLRATRPNVNRLAVWSVPARLPVLTQPHHLQCLTHIGLPKGNLPACLAIHPSQQRNLIATGSMDGRIDVYLLLSHKRSLTCVYTSDQVHPAFVTALTFLPPYLPTSSQVRLSTSPQSYELISVSIDQALRLHSGPSYTRIAHLIHGSHDPETESRWYRWLMSLCKTSANLLIIFLFPLILSLVLKLFSSFV